jgi:hypothetical protein
MRGNGMHITPMRLAVCPGDICRLFLRYLMPVACLLQLV